MDLSDILQSIQGFLDMPIVRLGDASFTTGRLIAFVLVLGGTAILAPLLRGLASRLLHPQSEEEKGAAAVAEPIVFYSVWIAGVLVALGAGGVNWVTLHSLLNASLFTLSGSAVSLTSILVVVIVVAISWGVSRISRRSVGHAFGSRGVDEGTVAITQRLIHYFVMAIGLGIALDTLGINLAALFAAGAVFAVGIGFAMQNIAQNFVSGLILLVERSIKPGDTLEVEGTVVVVEKMGIRTTVARTRDEEEIIIPNAMLVQNTVKNYTLRDSLYRLRGVVGVEYASDMRLVMDVLYRAADALEWRFKGRDPLVLLTEFGSSSVNFEVSVWMNDPWTAQRARSELHQAIWFSLKDADVTIAFPQLDVHFDAPIEDAARSFPRAS